MTTQLNIFHYIQLRKLFIIFTMFSNTLDKKSQIIYTLFKIPSKFNTPSGDVILTGYIVVDQKEKRVEIPKLKACNDFEQYKKEKERKKKQEFAKKTL